MAKSLGLARLPLDLLALLDCLGSVGDKGEMCISTAVVTACCPSSGVTCSLLSPKLLLSPFPSRTDSLLPALPSCGGGWGLPGGVKEEDVDTGGETFLLDVCCSVSWLAQFCSVISR